MTLKTVEGKIATHKVKLYTLSTCIWCKRLKSKLNEREITYSYVDIDLVPYVEKEALKKELRQIKPRLAFPMMFLDENYIPNMEINQKIEELVRDG